MEVILIENIEKLGKIGDVVKVKAGYARNYLLPRKKVLRANKENLKIFEEKKSIIEAEENKRKEKSIEISKKIKNSDFLVIRNASENDQLYGSVTSKDIIKEIKAVKNIDFLNEQINLKKPIKKLGVYKILISVYTNIQENILINVAKTKESAESQLKKYQNPKLQKSISKKVKTEIKEEKELSTKDLLKDIEKKDIKEENETKVKKTKTEVKKVNKERVASKETRKKIGKAVKERVISEEKKGKSKKVTKKKEIKKKLPKKIKKSPKKK